MAQNRHMNVLVVPLFILDEECENLILSPLYNIESLWHF